MNCPEDRSKLLLDSVYAQRIMKIPVLFMSEARRNYAAREFASTDASVRASNFQPLSKDTKIPIKDVNSFLDGVWNDIGLREVFDESADSDQRRFMQVDLRTGKPVGEMTAENNGASWVVFNNVITSADIQGELATKRIPTRHFGFGTDSGKFLTRVLDTSAADRKAWERVKNLHPDYRSWRAEQVGKMLDRSGQFNNGVKEEDVIALPPSTGPREIAVYVPQDTPHFIPDMVAFPESVAAQGQH